jgi:hypothetical protein
MVQAATVLENTSEMNLTLVIPYPCGRGNSAISDA